MALPRSATWVKDLVIALTPYVTNVAMGIVVSTLLVLWVFGGQIRDNLNAHTAEVKENTELQRSIREAFEAGATIEFERKGLVVRVKKKSP